MEFSNHPLNKNNVNDNEDNPVTNNDNVNENQVNIIAMKLADALNNPEGRLFYCKVGWKLPEAKIWSNLEIALGGRNPKNYFSWLCKREMEGVLR